MSEKSKVIKVNKNAEGDITYVMLDNGDVHSVDEAISMVKNNLIEGVNVAKSKAGKEYLRSNPNGVKDDNLDNLTTF